MHHLPHISPPAPSAMDVRTACPRVLPLAAALGDDHAPRPATEASHREPRPSQGAHTASAKAQQRRRHGETKAQRAASRLGIALTAKALVGAYAGHSQRSDAQEGSGAPLHAPDRPGAFPPEPFVPETGEARP